MRRIGLVLFALFALTFGMSTSAAAQDVDCGEISYERAQEILAADPSDPNDLDRDNDGEACDNNARGGGTSAGTTGGTGTTDTGTGTTGNTATSVPAVGSGTGLYSSDTSMLMVTAFGSIAAVLGLAALRLRQQS